MNELEARTERLQRQMEALGERVTEIEKSHSIADVVVQNIDRRLGGIEDSQKWIVRLILAAIITGLLGIVLVGGPT